MYFGGRVIIVGTFPKLLPFGTGFETLTEAACGAGTVFTWTILPFTLTGTVVPGGTAIKLPCVTGSIAIPPPGTMLAVGILVVPRTGA